MVAHILIRRNSHRGFCHGLQELLYLLAFCAIISALSKLRLCPIARFNGLLVTQPSSMVLQCRKKNRLNRLTDGDTLNRVKSICHFRDELYDSNMFTVPESNEFVRVIWQPEVQ